jgi:hypothetical protein
MYQPVAATGFRLLLQKFWPIVILWLNLPTHWCLPYGNLAMLTHYHSRQSYQNFFCYHFVVYHPVHATELTKPFSDLPYKRLLYHFYMSVSRVSVITRTNTHTHTQTQSRLIRQTWPHTVSSINVNTFFHSSEQSHLTRITSNIFLRLGKKRTKIFVKKHKLSSTRHNTFTNRKVSYPTKYSAPCLPCQMF